MNLVTKNTMNNLQVCKSLTVLHFANKSSVPHFFFFFHHHQLEYILADSISGYTNQYSGNFFENIFS